MTFSLARHLLSRMEALDVPDQSNSDLAPPSAKTPKLACRSNCRSLPKVVDLKGDLFSCTFFSKLLIRFVNFLCSIFPSDQRTVQLIYKTCLTFHPKKDDKIGSPRQYSLYLK